MLVAAALVPPTALLVPGAAGAATVLEAERDAALGAVRAMLAAEPERVVVLREGGVDTDLGGAPVGSLAAAGVPDEAWRTDAGVPAEVRAVADVPATVALWLLATAGWTGEVLVRAADAEPPDAVARAAGMATADPRRVAALLVGGASVRRGPDAPLAEDPRAPEVDAGLAAWLAGLGSATPRPAPAPEDVAWHRLDAVAPARVLAAALAEAALAEAALGGAGLAVAGRMAARLGPAELAVTTPLGATYVVATWRPVLPPGGATSGNPGGAA